MIGRKAWVCYDWEKNDLYREYFQARYDSRAQYKIQSESLNQALYQCWSGLLDLRENRLDAAQAKLAEVKSVLDKLGDPREAESLNGIYYLLSSEILLAKGLADKSITEFQKIPRPSLNLSDQVTIIIRNLPFRDDLAARAYERKGETERAIAEYERLLDFKNTGNDLIHPLSRFRLAGLYEKTGQGAKAREQYEKVLEIWKDAVPGLQQVEEAKSRLRALQAQ